VFLFGYVVPVYMYITFTVGSPICSSTSK
jgi:hypothetical protein